MRRRARQELEPLVVGLDDAERILSLGRSTIYELIDTGEFESFLVGRRRMLTYASLAAWVDRRRQEVA